MRPVDCATVRRHLSALHDGELPVERVIALRAHLAGCPPCSTEVRLLEEMRDALRTGAPALPADGLESLQARVVSRLEAEENQALPARVGRMLDDLHLVWAGLGAATATLACAATLFVIGYLAPPERADSISGLLSALASPVASEPPPVVDHEISPPRVTRDAPVRAVLVSTPPTEEDLVFALAAVVTQDGRLANPEVLLANRRDRQTIVRLMNAVAEARFEPASYRGAPVAANFVWLLTHTTVRAKAHS
jgi:anti-sigma factor (TIGR02949 family)